MIEMYLGAYAKQCAKEKAHHPKMMGPCFVGITGELQLVRR